MHCVEHCVYIACASCVHYVCIVYTFCVKLHNVCVNCVIFTQCVCALCWNCVGIMITSCNFHMMHALCWNYVIIIPTQCTHTLCKNYTMHTHIV